MSTTRTPSTTPTHDARHCGHVMRSSSPTVKRAAILAECEATITGWVRPTGETTAVLAVVEAILAGVSCSTLGALAGGLSWEADATEWADEQGHSFLTLPATPKASQSYGGQATGLSYLLPFLADVAV
jgi:hypothetical protein